MSGPLSAEAIDEAICALVLAGPGGDEAGVTLARFAGRALRMLDTIVGHHEAVVTVDTLAKLLRAGAIH